MNGDFSNEIPARSFEGVVVALTLAEAERRRQEERSSGDGQGLSPETRKDIRFEAEDAKIDST
jgi:hypothetical protein